MARFFLHLSKSFARGAAAMAVTLAIGVSAASAQRLFFIIATGPSGGTYFPVGQGVAALISHPPGLGRCDKAGVCGPQGMIASARTSAGAMANVLDVSAHRVNSGLVQADVVAEAVAGKGPFKALGPQPHIAVIADLFPEDVHLVAAKSAHIASVTALKGKRVSLGDTSSGTAVTAGAVLRAWRLSPASIQMKSMPSDVAAEMLEKGQLDAFFFVGGAPVGLVRDLIARGKAVLVPIDGAGRIRLLKASASLTATTLPAGTYPGTAAVQTVSVAALWVVNSDEPADTVYALTKSLFNPDNRAALDASHPSAHAIQIDSATRVLPVPLHPGAWRFYREAGKAPNHT